MRHVPEMSPFTFVYESRAHEQHAEQNEDTVLLDKYHGLAAIFDGMGSRKGTDVLGQIASQRAALFVRQGWERLLQKVQGKQGAQLPCDRLDLLAALRQLIQEAHEGVPTEGVRRAGADNASQSKLRSPKTTIALVSFCHRNDEGSDTIVSAHVGDSRIYLLREYEPLVRLTRDDGFLATLIQSQAISEMDALRIDQAMVVSQLSETELDYFYKRYGVTQMLGDEQPPTINVQQTPLLPGDRILLCSDGIHDNLLDEEIEELLRNGASEAVARLLVESAVRRSHQDSTITIRAKLDDMSALVITYHR